VIDKTYGHAAYGCGECCGYGQPKINPFSGPPAFDNQDLMLAQAQCGGYFDDVTDAAYNWWSNNTAVAELPTSMLHTVAPGSATGNASIQLQSMKPPVCPGLTWRPTQQVNVGPYQVELIFTASQGPANCSIHGQAGWVRNVTNQLQYQGGSPYAVSGLTVADTLSVGSTNQLGLSGPQTGQDTTTGDGSFQDTYFACSTVCPASTGYSNFLQQWTAYGVPLPHVNGVVYKCQSITIDGN